MDRPNVTIADMRESWMWCDAHPRSDLKAQLDQIEEKLDRIGVALGLVTQEAFDRYHPSGDSA